MLWMLAALWPRGPYPILALSGEQGSGKSMLSRLARRLTDPAGGDVLQPPRDDRDLAAAARHNRVLAFDNLSSLAPDLADSFCRLATGAEIGGRALYSDHDLATFAAARPILMNGIPDLATRADLASRSLVVALATLETVVSEAELLRRFDRVSGQLLGVLLDGMATALRRLPTTRTPQGYRMADFARLAAAAAPAFGWDPGEVVRLLAANADAQAATLTDSDSVAAAALSLVEEDDGFSGTATALHQRLCSLVGEAATRQADWPKLPHFLVGRLTRSAPALRKLGVVFTRRRGVRATAVSLVRQEGRAATSATCPGGSYMEERATGHAADGADVAHVAASPSCLSRPNGWADDAGEFEL